MARSMFPQDRLVLQRAGRSLVAAAGLRVRVTTDAAGTIPADVVALDGVTALTSLTVDDSSLLPLFLGPDGVDTLHLVRDSDGAYMGVLEAQVDPRLDVVPAMIDTALAGSRAAANTWTATQTFRPAAASGVGQIVQGLTSQTGDLTQWQNSAGTMLSRIDAFGSAYIGGAVGVRGANYMTAALGITPQSNESGIVVRGAASQSADLQQWQDSAGTVQARVMASGALHVQASGGSTVEIGATGIDMSFGSNSGGGSINLKGGSLNGFGNIHFPAGDTLLLSPTTNIDFAQGAASSSTNLVLKGRGMSSIGFLGVAAQTAATVGVAVKGAASQSADLQQWQNSAGTVLAKIAADGEYERVTAGAGIVLASPNGTRYRVTVADTGTLTTTAI